MGFRRRQKLFPGVYLNFSSKGISATIGVKGLNVNLGSIGAYLNTGIPGTGIYDRKKIADWTDKSTIPQIENYIPEEQPYYFLPERLKGEIKSSDSNSVTSQGLEGVKETLLEAYQEREDIFNEIPRVEIEIKKAATYRLLSQIFIFGLFTDKFKERYNEKGEYLADLKLQYDNCNVQIDIHIDQNIKERYENLRNAFEKLSQSYKIWDKTSAVKNTENKSAASQSVTRTETILSYKKIDFINSSFDALYFKNQNGGDIYIYPAFAVVFDNQNKFGLVDLSELKITFQTQKFLEDEDIPGDATVVGETWMKVNVDGSPDKRFKGNYQIPILDYGEIEFKSASGIFEVFMFSNEAVAYNFAEHYKSYINSNFIANPHPTSVKKQEYDFDNVTFKSDKQEAITGTSTEATILNDQRIISIVQNRFKVELPDNTIITGMLIKKSSDKDNTQFYETNNGCPFVVKSDRIFINLYKTHQATYTYFI